MFIVLAGIAVLFALGYFFPLAGILGMVALIAAIILFVVDALLLFRPAKAVEASRRVPNRLSNGDVNTISISLQQHYRFRCRLNVVDELPFQFQQRGDGVSVKLPPGGRDEISYEVTPTKRGVYSFGAINIFASTLIGFSERRFWFDNKQEVPVYPSFIQMRKYELHAISHRLSDVGIKKIRRRGHTMEFDQIKEYVRGDDVRSINWKATARAGDLMVNQYQDERSQRVYSVIDTGRVMKLPFEDLTLLNYAINASLALSNIALLKGDKAGLITFGDQRCRMVKAQKKKAHIYRIQEALYNIDANFKESDFRRLLNFLHSNIKQRSLILFFTNFESLSSMKRKLPVLRQIAASHLLVTIFFVNTELDALLDSRPTDQKEIYIKAVAEKFSNEKRSIVNTLQQQGIQTILTPPEDLSVSTINTYLDLKAKGMV